MVKLMTTFFAFLVLAGIVFLAIRLGRLNHNSGQSRSTTKHQATSHGIRSAEIRSVQSARFDAKSAKHLHHKRTLVGPVFVTDGDTIKIKNTQVRLFGIDAPELNHPHGKNAKWALHKLCKGHTVRAEITEVDDYGRTVAQCFLPDGRDLSAEMVKLGLAIDWKKFSGGKYKHLETSDARKKLFLADARQKGRMHVWESFEAKRAKP
jgi:endonuclease YncB( thermonuclease family)